MFTSNNRRAACGLRPILPALIAALLVSGCIGDPERIYKDLAEVRKTNDYSVVAATAVPEDATQIRVNLSAESGHSYVSYVTASKDHAIRALHLSPVPDVALKQSRRSLGLGISLPENAEMYGGCRDRWPPPSPGQQGEKEVLLLANTPDRQYQWNQLYDDELIHSICS